MSPVAGRFGQRSDTDHFKIRSQFKYVLPYCERELFQVADATNRDIERLARSWFDPPWVVRPVPDLGRRHRVAEFG
jgi:hypothetical protein